MREKQQRFIGWRKGAAFFSLLLFASPVFAACPEEQKTSGYEVYAEAFDCGFLSMTQEWIEEFREIYPAVEDEVRKNSSGRPLRFEFDLPVFGNLARLAEKDGSWFWTSNARALRLKVEWQERGRFGYREIKSWEHYFPYHPYGIEGERDIREIEPLVRSLIESFFVEKDAQHRRFNSSTTYSLPKPWELLKVSERVTLFFPNGKFNSFGPAGDVFIGEHSFVSSLTRELRHSLTKMNLPRQVQSFTLHVLVTCLRGFPGNLVMRDMGMRRFPSTTGGCLPWDQKVLAFYGEAYDQENRRLILGLPTHALGGNFDTLPLPYHPGQIQMVLSRFQVMIEDALRVSPKEIANAPLLPYDFGPHALERLEEVLYNMGPEKFRETLEQARSLGIRDE